MTAHGDGTFDLEFEPEASPAPTHRPGATAVLDERLVSLVAPTSFEAEQYRMLRYRVEQRHKGAAVRVVALTSPGGGEGKTTTAVNLAGALAQGPDARVLLIEADLRRPSLMRLLGLRAPGEPGLVEAVLNPRARLDDVVRIRQRFNLAFVPAGRPPISPYEVLKSARLGELIGEARRSYDYVLVDTPPNVPCPDYRLIERWVDASILVVAAHRTRQRLVEQALQQMDAGRIMGLVFNGDDTPEAEYHKGSSEYQPRSRTVVAKAAVRT